MTTFTTEDRASAEEPIPFMGWVQHSDDTVTQAIRKWEQLFNVKLHEVMNKDNPWYDIASISPTANGSCARELIAEEYYRMVDRIFILEKRLREARNYINALVKDDE